MQAKKDDKARSAVAPFSALALRRANECLIQVSCTAGLQVVRGQERAATIQAQPSHLAWPAAGAFPRSNVLTAASSALRISALELALAALMPRKTSARHELRMAHR